MDTENNTIFNTLIVSPPGAGKTTIIRDLAKRISNGINEINFRGLDVSIIDERGEIAAMTKGITFNDVGIRTDVLDNVQKEIDFVVNKGDKRVYSQSAWQMNTDEKTTAELDSLKLAKDFFPKIIIQNDIPSHYTDNDGLIHCNLIEFLLKPELIAL